jgi:hypothetical protein
MDKIIFATILILFPLGQLTKINGVNLIDVAVGLLAVITILKKPKYPEWFKYFSYFILFCLFGLIINYSLFTFSSFLYLARLFLYAIVAIYVFNFVKDKTAVGRWLLAISIASASLGWVQYLLLPDTRFLFNFGWDDHLYRMVGTFFDPTYLALILLLGIVISLQQKSYKAFWFLLISLAFTYSRATYLALGLLLLFKRKFLAIAVFAIVVLLLPKMLSEGTDFGRVVSGNNKIENYNETIQIFLQSPAVGVGFNNICVARENRNLESHSCNGADSSVLFLLATTGVIGFILFINFVLHVPKLLILNYSFLIVLVHSTFANSLFYPHIMLWLFILVGLQTKVSSQRS